MTTSVRESWRKSSFSNNGGASCVEVKVAGGQVLLRDSKYLRDPANSPDTQPVISVHASLWAIFLQHCVRPTTPRGHGMPAIERKADGWVMIHGSDGSGVVLAFNPDEWSAFVNGVNSGEFELAAA
ncbi:DUF397 domain-containing protein [Nocardia sp. CA-128927]|uniref:DUF397 domain-containing protein n=1 Tax=Nocardia sp. CA-128927 TaxID=3239975 RepID=UPI003D98E125